MPTQLSIKNEAGEPMAFFLSSDGSVSTIPYSGTGNASPVLMNGTGLLKPKITRVLSFNSLDWWQLPDDDFEGSLKRKLKKLRSLLPAEAESDFDQVALQTIEPAYRKARKSLVRHSRLIGAKRRRKDSIRLYKQAEVKLCAAIETALHFHETGREALPTLGALFARSVQVWPGMADDEGVKVLHQEKPDGKSRTTFAFGPVQYAQQKLLTWILNAQHCFRSNDFSLPKRGGIHAAAQFIGQHIEDGSAPWWMVADVRHAYPSVTRRVVSQVFDLDKRILRYIAVPTLPFYGDQDHSLRLEGNPTRKEALRPQLPQGGAHSPILWSAIMDTVLRRMPKADLVVHCVYADNVAIGAPTAELAMRAYSEFRAALTEFSQEAGLGAGGLTLHEQCLCYGRGNGSGKPVLDRKLKVRTADFVEFCGYAIYLDQYGEGLKYRPSWKAQSRLRSCIKKEWMSAPLASDLELLRMATKRWVKWQRGFPLWAKNRSGNWRHQRRKLFISLALNWISDFQEQKSCDFH